MKNIVIKNRVTKKRANALSLLSVLFGLTLTCLSAQAVDATSLDELLNKLAQGNIAQSSQNKMREAEFMAKKNQQSQLLAGATKQRDGAIVLSNQLETNFQDNEVVLANKTDALNKRMGELKELFGVLQQVASDTRSKFQTSVISAQIPGRSVFLDELTKSMGSTSKLASIEEIERLWFELQREMLLQVQFETLFEMQC